VLEEEELLDVWFIDSKTIFNAKLEKYKTMFTVLENSRHFSCYKNLFAPLK